MQPFDADDLMHVVSITRKGLECHQPMEFDYHGAKVVPSWFNANLCAYCDIVHPVHRVSSMSTLSLSREVACFLFAQRAALIGALPFV